jgi:uncharacterized protein YqfA (UPF0365 family)
MAEAFRAGRLGVMDYYGMRNLQADTDMRRSIADPKSGGPEGKQG